MLHHIGTALDEMFYVFTVVLLSTFLTIKNWLFYLSGFSQKFPNCGLLYFWQFKFRTLTPSRFNNQTNDRLKPLGHNWNHQQGFLKQKIVTLHCCSFNLKFPKHLFWQLFWVNTIHEIIVTTLMKKLTDV